VYRVVINKTEEVTADVILKSKAFIGASGRVEFERTLDVPADEIAKKYEGKFVEIFIDNLKIFEGFITDVFVHPEGTKAYVAAKVVGWQRIVKDFDLRLPRFIPPNADLDDFRQFAWSPIFDLNTAFTDCKNSCALTPIESFITAVDGLLGYYQGLSDVLESPVNDQPKLWCVNASDQQICITPETFERKHSCVPPGVCGGGASYPCIEVDDDVAAHKCCYDWYFDVAAGHFFDINVTASEVDSVEVGLTSTIQTEPVGANGANVQCSVNGDALSIGNEVVCTKDGCKPPADGDRGVLCMFPDIELISSCNEPCFPGSPSLGIGSWSTGCSSGSCGANSIPFPHICFGSDCQGPCVSIFSVKL